MMERLGLDVIKVEVPWGEGVPEDKLEQILKEDTNKEIKAVTVVHNETTTGKTRQIFTKTASIASVVRFEACILIAKTKSFSNTWIFK